MRNHDRCRRNVAGFVVLVGQAAERVAEHRVGDRHRDDLPLDDAALVAGQVQHDLVVVAPVAAAENGPTRSGEVVGEPDARSEVVEVVVPLPRLGRVLMILVRGPRLQVVAEARG